MKNSKLNIVVPILVVVILVLIIMLFVKNNEHFRWQSRDVLQGHNLKGMIAPFHVDFNNGREINRLRSLGWYLCDGTRGTPDLTDKFILGGSHKNPHRRWKARGGSETVALLETNIPKHHHNTNVGRYNAGSTAEGGLNPNYKHGSVYTDTWGGKDDWSAEPHENMPPYFVLAYFIFL